MLHSGECCFVTQLCPALRDPMDCRPPSSSVHGILQARILEWVASLRDLLNPGIEPISSALAGGFLTTELLGRRGFDPWVKKVPLEKETATHPSILAWEIPWTEEPGRLQFMGLQRSRTPLATNNSNIATKRFYYCNLALIPSIFSLLSLCIGWTILVPYHSYS